MAKLTKQDRQTLRQVLHDLERGIKYLKSKHVELCIDGSKLPEYGSYKNEEGRRLLTINKEMGSNIAGLHQAADALANYLVTH